MASFAMSEASSPLMLTQLKCFAVRFSPSPAAAIPVLNNENMKPIDIKPAPRPRPVEEERQDTLPVLPAEQRRDPSPAAIQPKPAVGVGPHQAGDQERVSAAQAEGLHTLESSDR